MTLTVVEDTSVVRLAADGSVSTLYAAPKGDVLDFVPTRGGWVALASAEVAFRTAHGTVRIPAGRTEALAAGGDVVWLGSPVGYTYDLTSYTLDGRRRGRAVRLPEGSTPTWRMLSDGGLLGMPPDTPIVETWRPDEGFRDLRLMAVLLASTPTHVAWWDYDAAAPAVHVLDVATRAEWSSPLPRGVLPSTGTISDDGTAVAYVSGADPAAYVARRDDPAPRLVAAATSGHSFDLDFASDGRLLVVETGWGEEWVAYAWDGRLVRLGVHDLSPVRAVYAD